MLVRSLHVENFRGFPAASLELDPRVTLLVGANGTGKTALLDAIAVGLGAWVNAFDPTAPDRPLRRSDAHLSRHEGAGLATVNAAWPVRVVLQAELPGVPPSSQASFFGPQGERWARELAGPRARTSTSPATLRSAARALATASASDPAVELPLLASYGTMRLWVQKRDKADRQRHLTARAGGYAACLEAATDQALFERWMARRTQDYLQRFAEVAGEGRPRVPRPHLDAVEKAAVTVLEGVERFRFDINQDTLWVEFASGQGLPFSHLSDGQRSLLLLATDIAWRCCQLNPHFGALAPEKTRGVVLIDEIELHLHPQWQRRVIPALCEAFPLMQFVLSTHSPQVVSTAKAGWLRVLAGDGSVIHVSHTEGRDTNALLRDVFGVSERPAEALAQLEAVEAQLAQGEHEAARLALREIEARVGSMDDRLRGLQWELSMASAEAQSDA